MGILYNANLTPAMNDSSVTSGNADGWVYYVAGALEVNVVRPSEQGARRPADSGPSAPSGKSTKRRAR
jgi:hypothetical protein